ncbi:MAG TPA: hypothetical protein VK926_01680 [Gaiellaceae bacterium]|nr:hypothetical protein [Gaiellaceae bacterium]
MARAGCLAATLATAALLAATAFVWFFLLSDGATPTSVDDAVATFRESGAGAGDSPVPEGVYVYATDGFEKTDALTGVMHGYPARSTITVTSHECGVQMRWDVLEGRSTTWVFCDTASGWTLESQDERHTFFGRTERTTYACERSLFRPAGDEPGTALEATCSTGTAEERSTGRVVGRETLRVGRAEVETVHLRRTSILSGDTRGGSTHDFWIDRASGVPVQIVMVSRTTNDSLVGDVRYEEDVSLRLTSLTPRR